MALTLKATAEDLLHPSHGWNEARLERCKHLWLIEGRSATEIARELKGVSRNAVIGQAFRRGWKRDAPGSAKAQKAKPAPSLRTARGNLNNGPSARAFLAKLRERRPEPEPAPLLQEIPATAKPWVERASGECAYPVTGIGADTFSCCLPSGDKTYCPGHARIMFAPKSASELRQEKRYIDRLARSA